MDQKAIIQQAPRRRARSRNGMIVTSETWEETHEQHYQQQRFHALAAHGTGILTGLEVIASNPADTYLNVLPGIAIDPAGNAIVVREQRSCSVADNLDQTVYLLLADATPAVPQVADSEGGPAYIEYKLKLSATDVLPSGPYIELARVRRSSRSAIFRDAASYARPAADEIDLRYRQQVGPAKAVRAGVWYPGQDVPQLARKHAQGAAHLALTLDSLGLFHIAFEDADLQRDLSPYTLLYVVDQGGWTPSQEQADLLARWIKGSRGTLFLETANPTAGRTLDGLSRLMNLKFEPPAPGHPLLTEPYLFASIPSGFDPRVPPRILAGEGVIFSDANYGMLWGGETCNGPAQREEIRSAVEWGCNLVAYAARRRRG